MSIVRGCLPVLFLFLATGFAAAAHSQQRIPLTLAEAEDLALDREPGRAAFEARSDALAEESVAAGQLPDPVLRIGLANYPLDSGGFSTEAMTQGQLGFHQVIPPGRSRQIGTRRFEALAREMTENANGRDRDVLTAVRQAWLEAYYWQRARTIVEESRPYFADLVTVARSLYSVGRKNQQDLLRAELELARIDDRLIDIDRNLASAIAALSQWVGDDAGRPIAEKLPQWDEIPPLETLETGVSAHPVLRAAEARIEARQAGVDLAEEKKKPGWALDLGYGYREGYLANGDPRSDMVSLSVSVDLPFFQKNRQDRKLAAALSERRAATDSKDELSRQLQSRLGVEFARWRELGRRIALYEDRILSLAGENAQAALAAYQSDAGDFADVMRGYIEDINTRIELIRLQVERARIYATLANLGGIPR